VANRPWLFSWEQPWLSKKFVDYLPSNFIYIRP
jgi:hypothetical protein